MKSYNISPHAVDNDVLGVDKLSDLIFKWLTGDMKEEVTKPSSQRSPQVKKDDKIKALKHAHDQLTDKESVSTVVYASANAFLKRESKADGNFYTKDLLEAAGWKSSNKKEGNKSIFVRVGK